MSTALSAAAGPAEAEAEETRPTAGMARIALGLTYLACVAEPWNGFKVVGFRPGDALMFLALFAFAASDLGQRWPTLPGWAWQFAGAILLVTALHELIPTDPNYLASRLVVDTRGFRIPEFEGNLTVGLKFVVPITLLPLMIGFARFHDRRGLFRCMYAYAIGSAISGLIGFSDGLGITQISRSVSGLAAIGGRAPGLSIHPNFLATTCVLSTPLMLWQLMSPRPRTRVLALIVLVPLVVGLYASGSRGGFAVMGGAVLLCFAIMPPYRRVLPTVLVLAGAVGAVTFVLKPSLGAKLLQAVRLGGGNTGSAQGSDSVRSLVSHQGWMDFKHSPLDGVGMQVAEEAHNVYLQALASGGLLLMAGFLIFVFSGLWKSFNRFSWDPLAYPLFIAAFAGAILAFVENALVDRLAYVPLAIIAMMPPNRLTDPDNDVPVTIPERHEEWAYP